MDHLEILKEAGRTISSPARFIKGGWVTDRGGCSMGHLAVAGYGKVASEIQGEGAQKFLRSDPEALKALRFVAEAMFDGYNYIALRANPMSMMGKRDLLKDPKMCEAVVMGFNDSQHTGHGDVIRAFQNAIQMAEEAQTPKITEADIFPEDPPKIKMITEKAEPVPSLDFEEVDSLLTESAKGEELVAA